MGFSIYCCVGKEGGVRTVFSDEPRLASRLGFPMNSPADCLSWGGVRVMGRREPRWASRKISQWFARHIVCVRGEGGKDYGW